MKDTLPQLHLSHTLTLPFFNVSSFSDVGNPYQTLNPLGDVCKYKLRAKLYPVYNLTRNTKKIVTTQVSCHKGTKPFGRELKAERTPRL